MGMRMGLGVGVGVGVGVGIGIELRGEIERTSKSAKRRGEGPGVVGTRTMSSPSSCAGTRTVPEAGAGSSV